MLGASPLIAPLLLVVFVVLTIILRFLHFSEQFLAIGIISIIGYFSFIVWAYSTAPSGDNKFPVTGPKYFELISTLTIGYGIQDFVAQILIKTTTADKYRRIILWVYGIGFFLYTIFSLAGFSILNREANVEDPDTIEQYFPSDGWQVRAIYSIFSLHMITTAP